MLTFHYVPYTLIEHLTSAKRVNLLLGMVKTNDVILLEGKLKPKEETALIKKTMEHVSRDFPGIEISTMKDTTANEDLMTRLKAQFYNVLMGDRSGFTIIGPASIIREIKQDPDKIHLLLNGDDESDLQSKKTQKQDSKPAATSDHAIQDEAHTTEQPEASKAASTETFEEAQAESSDAITDEQTPQQNHDGNNIGG